MAILLNNMTYGRMIALGFFKGSDRLDESLYA